MLMFIQTLSSVFHELLRKIEQAIIVNKGYLYRVQITYSFWENAFLVLILLYWAEESFVYKFMYDWLIILDLFWVNWKKRIMLSSFCISFINLNIFFE